MQYNAQTAGLYLPPSPHVAQWIAVPVARSNQPIAPSPIQVNVDTESFDEIPSNDVVKKSSLLRRAAWVIAATILTAVLAVGVAVPTVVSQNSTSTTLSITTTVMPTTTGSTIITTTPAATATTMTTITTTQNPYGCANMTVLYGLDYNANNIGSGSQANYSLCCSWCLTWTGCGAITYGLSTAGCSAGICYLKSGTTTPTANSALVSAHF